MMMNQTTLARAFVLSLCAICLTFSAQNARAEVKDGVMKRLASSNPVRRRQMMRDGRFELGLTLGSSTGEMYQTTATVGAQAQLYLTDSFGIGAYVFYGLNFESSLAEKVRAERPDRVSKETFSGVGLGSSLEAVIIPAYGKASLLGVINGKYDLNITLGAGAVQVTGEGLEKFAIAPVIGVGSRFFINESLAVNIQLRDYVYQRAQNVVLVKDPTGQIATPLVEESWMSHFFITATFSFFAGKPKVSP